MGPTHLPGAHLVLTDDAILLQLPAIELQHGRMRSDGLVAQRQRGHRVVLLIVAQPACGMHQGWIIPCFLDLRNPAVFEHALW